MANDTKRRQDLKSYFVKNAIPTEGNFADLIDAQLNQTDDGVFKRSGEPLSVVAAAGDQKRVLGLYSDYPAANVDWFLSLKPAQNPADASTVRSGFGVTDGAGYTRLFIDSSTGRVGLGTNNPADSLQVSQGDLRVEGGSNRRLKIIADTDSAGISIAARNAGSGRPFLDLTFGELDAAAGVRLSATSNTAAKLEAKGGDVALTVSGSISATGSITGNSLIATTTLGVTGLATLSGGVNVGDGNIGAHINKDGAFYRTGGQVYITVDDNLYIRDIDGTVRASFSTDSGLLKLTGNAGIFQLEGTNHVYQEFYPQGIGAGRFGWLGFSSSGAADLTLKAEKGALYFVSSSSVVSSSAFNASAGLVATTITASGLVTANAGLSVTTIAASGLVTANAGVNVGDGNVGSHVEKDGAFYRYGGQAHITVDDYLYIRDMSANSIAFTFNTNTGDLAVTGRLTAASVSLGNASYDVEKYLVPEGTIVMWSGAVNAIPTNWFLCDGRTISKSGSSFVTPNLTNRFVRGTNGTAGGTGGADSVTLSSSNMPSHSHGYMDIVYCEAQGLMPAGYTAMSVLGNKGSNGTDTDNVGWGRSATTDATGSGQSFSILPSYLSLCFIIFKPGWA